MLRRRGEDPHAPARARDGGRPEGVLNATPFHPDFLAAPPERRWPGGSFAELAVKLREGAWAQPGEWCWYVLPRGLRLGMRVRLDHRRELRLALTAESAVTEGRWVREMYDLTLLLACEDWIPEHAGRAKVQRGGRADYEARYLERRVSCWRCARPVEADPAFPRPTCNACALALGHAEVRERVKAGA